MSVSMKGIDNKSWLQQYSSIHNNDYSKCYVVRTVHFGIKLYNDQRNAQVFNLFTYLLLLYLFRAFF
jgi:hypothetical protein